NPTTAATTTRPFSTTATHHPPPPTTAAHSRSPPPTTAVMTIDKSWTTISNRNSDAFLDGLFAFIKHFNGVKFVVHERDILHTTQCSGVSTPGLDGEMYYGQLEEILELTYIGHRKGIHHILTDREFHKNNQYILATQATQVFYLQDLARQPRGWKVVEHVYHRDVAESDQDVIHGSSSSHVTLSVGLTNLEHTDLGINAQSTEVDAPPVNDDNANANKDNAHFINNEDDVVAHALDDDDVVVSDDDEVNPCTNVEEVLSSDDSDDDN
ncbi:Myc-type, basic helix-loop-helix domain-containing protein, partial [Tanacetum coccineum]